MSKDRLTANLKIIFSLQCMKAGKKGNAKPDFGYSWHGFIGLSSSGFCPVNMANGYWLLRSILISDIFEQ